MEDKDDKFRFVILTQEGKVLEELVEKVVCATTEGEMVIIKECQPMMVTTCGGRLTFFNDSKEFNCEIKAGVIKVSKDEVILMSHEVIKK